VSVRSTAIAAITATSSVVPVAAEERGRGDADLVALVVAGSPEALAELWRRHGGRVYGLARQLCGADRASDVAQGVFVALWQRPGRYDVSRGSVRSYLLRDAHGRAVDLLRGESSCRAREQHYVAGRLDYFRLEDEAMARLAGERVWRALDVLAGPARQAIVLAYFGGLSYRDVAAALGQPEGAVKSWIRAGLSQVYRAVSVPPQEAGGPFRSDLSGRGL
jgi:RNA polymerase sigma-70 factor (ECF subfamily)